MTVNGIRVCFYVMGSNVLFNYEVGLVDPFRCVWNRFGDAPCFFSVTKPFSCVSLLVLVLFSFLW